MLQQFSSLGSLLPSFLPLFLATALAAQVDEAATVLGVPVAVAGTAGLPEVEAARAVTVAAAIVEAAIVEAVIVTGTAAAEGGIR